MHPSIPCAALVLACAPFAALAATPDNLSIGSAFSDDAGRSVKLTRDGQSYESGGVWQTAPVSLRKSFRVHFSWHIQSSLVPLGDGLAFVIQTDGTHALGEYGGGLGAKGLHGVASVVQATGGGQLGLTLSLDTIAAKPVPVDLMDAHSSHGSEVVTYDAVARTLTMTGTVTVNGVDYPVDDEKDVDLSELLQSDTATVGFTGGAGSYNADNSITGYKFEQRP